MIESNDVDLTVERKFGSIPFNRSHDSIDRIRLPKSYEFSLIFGKRSSFLPWNNKKISSDTELKKKFEDDELSNEYGERIRMTSDNHLWVVKGGKKEWHKEAFEEFLMETIGGYPYFAFNTCIECGKRKISPYKDLWRYYHCKKCNSKVSIIPWKR